MPRHALLLLGSCLLLGCGTVQSIPVSRGLPSSLTPDTTVLLELDRATVRKRVIRVAFSNQKKHRAERIVVCRDSTDLTTAARFGAHTAVRRLRVGTDDIQVDSGIQGRAIVSFIRR